MKEKNKRFLGLLIKGIFISVGTALLIISVIVVVKNSNSDTHVITSTTTLIIGASFVGVSLPFKSKKNNKIIDNNFIEELTTKEKKFKNTTNLLARIYCLLIGVSSLVGSVIVYLNKGTSNQEYIALALALLIIGFIFSALALLSKEKY